MSSLLEKAHESKDVDLATAARGVWLVKVPKYLSEKWTKADGTGEVGKLRINKPRTPGGKPEVVFSLNESLSKPSGAPGEQVTVPKEHKFVMTGITSQQLSVLAQHPHTDGLRLPWGEVLYDKLQWVNFAACTQRPVMITGENKCDQNADKVSLEGKVIQRAECRPMGDASYMRLKRIQLEKDNAPTREIVRLDNVVQNYKPIAAHSFNLQQEAKKKEEGKRARLDKDKVQDMLFSAFEKHQYYNVKDLVRITQQPITYLKEILKEMCTYNMRAPHKNMWELKPEYRHYKEEENS